MSESCGSVRRKAPFDHRDDSVPGREGGRKRNDTTWLGIFSQSGAMLYNRDRSTLRLCRPRDFPIGRHTQGRAVASAVNTARRHVRRWESLFERTLTEPVDLGMDARTRRPNPRPAGRRTRGADCTTRMRPTRAQRWISSTQKRRFNISCSRCLSRSFGRRREPFYGYGFPVAGSVLSS